MNRLTRTLSRAVTALTPMDQPLMLKRWVMRRRIASVSGALLAAGLLVGYAMGLVGLSETARATPAVGVTSTAIAQGRFDPFDTKIKSDVKTGDKTDTWEAELRATGPSDLYVLENTIAPGGTYGWHSHPGPSLVIVKSGTATFYLADDPTCTPHVVPAGSSFVDAGGDVHMVRNEGSVDLVLVVTSLVPAGAVRRIDQPDPGHCQ